MPERFCASSVWQVKLDRPRSTGNLLEGFGTVKHLARRQPLWQAQGVADQGAHRSSPCPGMYSARPSGCMVDAGENKQAAILVPPDGGLGVRLGANIDIESTVCAGKKRHGSQQSPRLDFLFLELWNHPRDSKHNFSSTPGGQLWIVMCIEISGRAKVHTQVGSAFALTYCDMFYRCSLYE